MIRKLYKFALAILIVWPVHVMAASSLDGTWYVEKSVGAPGVHTANPILEARQAEGLPIIIQGKIVKLYNNRICNITGAKKVKLSDFDFGSAGGSWQRVGIKPVGEDTSHYDVVEVGMKCEASKYEDPNRVIMIANDGKLVLIDFWETWAQVKRAEQ